MTTAAVSIHAVTSRPDVGYMSILPAYHRNSAMEAEYSTKEKRQ